MLSRLAILVIVATTLTTLGSLGARAGWLLELLSHFPVQYLVAQVIAAAICFGLRLWPWAGLALLAAVPNVVAIAPYLPGLIAARASPVAGNASVNLVALNLLYTQEDPTRARAFLLKQSADIVVLSEFTPRWRKKLAVLEQTYPYFALRDRWNQWGIAVYSKYPFQDVEDLDLGDDQSSHLRILLQLPGGRAEVYAVHLASPPSQRRAAQRNTQLRRLAARIAAADTVLPKIVVGDFNSTPFSPFFRDLLRDTGLMDARRSFGWHYTWPALPVPVWIAIDHCLVSTNVVVNRVAAGPPIGSDHLPLECAFSLSP
jgi:endonuclease/exonuclease/phosphatase (EEP) superfamily protein YafD